jgi:hypothetical protein
MSGAASGAADSSAPLSAPLWRVEVDRLETPIVESLEKLMSRNAVKHPPPERPDTVGVTGSIPAAPTTEAPGIVADSLAASAASFAAVANLVANATSGSSGIPRAMSGKGAYSRSAKVWAPRSYRLIMSPVTSCPVRSEIHALLPARRAHVQNIARRSWKRSAWPNATEIEAQPWATGRTLDSRRGRMV